ncbi:neuraminidase-like domain-containing protein [Roseovarius sp. E0-M6]|uniref:Tc toxin subunit A-related protein n=1 Tax=Roseovarius sp. E0-M6 TaxID=3127118 RepID=UPI0030105293
MKLEIRLITSPEERALAHGELTLFLVLKDGKPMTLGPREANNRGELVQEDLPSRIMQQIDFEASQYQITHEGKSTPKLPLGKPQRVDKGHFRYILPAKGLSGRKPRAETFLEVVLVMTGANGQPLNGLVPTLTYADAKGGRFITRGEASERGQAVVRLEHLEPTDVAPETFEVIAERAEHTYQSRGDGKIERSDTGWIINVAMEPLGSTNPRPPQPPEPPEPPRPPRPPSTGMPDPLYRDGPYSVSGGVTDAEGTPLPDYYVEVVDRALKKERRLGAQPTAKNGRYHIMYADDHLITPRERNLLVRLSGPPKYNTVLSKSGLIMDAGKSEKVDFVLAEGATRELSLYFRLFQAVEPFVEGDNPSAFDAEDVAWLASKTGENAVALAHFVRAWDMVEEFGLPALSDKVAAAPFGWALGGLALSVDTIITTANLRLRKLLEDARAANWIPAIDFDTIFATLSELRKAHAADSQGDLVRLMRACSVRQRDLGTVLDVALSERPQPEKWDVISEIISNRNAAQLRAAVDSWRVLGHDATLTITLVKSIGLKSAENLVSIDRAAMIGYLREGHEMPAEIEGATENARLGNYATALLERIEAAFPTAAFVTYLQKSDVKIAQERADEMARRPNIDLTRPADLRMLAHEDMLDSTDASNGLADLATLFVIAPASGRGRIAEIVMDVGLYSSNAVRDQGLERFIDLVETKIGDNGREIASDVYLKAAHLGSMSTALGLRDEDRDNDPPSTMVGQLFDGALEGGCSECRSIFSPSAYYVDLLKYLDEAALNGVQDTGLALLSDRRPDLLKLRLDCANSHTLMPYIDLTLEVLEGVVGNRQSDHEDLQTTWEADQLAAEPQHRFDAAYDVIATARFPWVLPYNIDLDRTRAYLHHLGLGHGQLRRATRLNTVVAAAQLADAAAVLGIADAGKITLGQAPKWQGNWGVQNQGQFETHGDLNALARLLQLPAETTLALLNSAFVNPQATTLVLQDGSLSWPNNQTNLAAMLDRMQYLGRLLQQTDLPLDDLDQFLKLPQVANVGHRDQIIRLAMLQELSGTVGCSFSDLTTALTGTARDVATLLAMGSDADADAIITLADEIGFDPTVLEELRLIVDALVVLDFHNLTVDTAIALIQMPADDSPFHPTQAAALLADLVDAISRIGLPEATPTGEILVEDAEVSETLSAALEAATEVLSQGWDIAEDVLNDLLNTPEKLASILRTAGVTLSTMAAQSITADELARFGKQAQIADAAGLTHLDIAVSAQLANTMNWQDVTGLPVAPTDGHHGLSGLLRLLDYQRVNVLWFSTQTSDSDLGLFERLKIGQSDLAAMQAALGAAPGGWDASDLSFAFGADGFNFSTMAQFRNQDGLLAVERLMAVASALGSSAATVWSLARTPEGDLAQSTLQDQIAEDDYFAALKQINDPLRERQRDALLAKILNDNRGFRNTADVYEHYLIDPEMGACFDTSRTKQAIASAQQLVQRIQLNLEAGNGFAPEAQRQWVWRKNYRVWEANRKVFLYPENWIEPELRDNKTPLFKELEDLLLEGEVTKDSAEVALMNYARGLHALSRLEMVATVKDSDKGAQWVFARTSGHPRKFYMAMRCKNGLWSGWEPLDFEIESNHVLPVFHGGRLFLFWAHLTPKVDNRNQAYRTELSGIEADEEVLRTELNEVKRRIDDYDKKQQEYQEQANEQYAGMRPLWQALANAFGIHKNNAEADLITITEDLTAVKSSKGYLDIKYTYFEVHLSWSYYHPVIGWRAPVRATEHIDTIYIDENADQVHLRHERSVWLRARVSGDSICVELRRSAGYEDGDLLDYRLGTFTFDPLLEGLTVEDEREAEKLRRTNHFPTLVRYGQKLSSLHALPRFEIEVDELPVELMRWDPNEQHIRVYAEEIVGYAPTRRPFLMASHNRAYIVEPSQGFVGGPVASLGVSEAAQRNVAPTLSLSAVAGASLQVQPLPASFGAQPIRPAAFAVGTSNKRLFDGALSSTATLNQSPVAVGQWAAVEKVLTPPTTPARATGSLTTGQHWTTTLFYHPFSDVVVTELFARGLTGLYAPRTQAGGNAAKLFRQSHTDTVFAESYTLLDGLEIAEGPDEKFVFNRAYPYSIYNWELFFHAPFAIARQLTRNRQYEEARRWLHFVFDPVNKDGPLNASAWRFGPFHETHRALQQGDSADLIDSAEEDFAEFEANVEEWERNPFNPHAVARLRNVSYMRATFIAYIENLLAWADDLFRRDTMESVAEAAQLYIHAAQLMGPAPFIMPAYDEPGRAVSAEEHLAGARAVHPLIAASSVTNIAPPEEPPNDFFKLFGEFCVPQSDKMLGYWDQIADRLFKIRHCMNIEGVERTLALYQPPIDPALLVRAAAAGVDIGAAVAGLSAPRPHYRFSFMIQKALEFTADVRALGAGLLAALEKKDAETLAHLRASHEVAMNVRMLEIRAERLTEAQTAHEALMQSLFSAMDRRDHYQNLIDEDILPQEEKERANLNKANLLNHASGSILAVSSALNYVPDSGATGVQPTFKFGGIHLGSGLRAAGEAVRLFANQASHAAAMNARDAANIRRGQDWTLQRNLAARDVDRLEKDQIASEIRIAIAEKEIADQELRIAQSKEAETFLADKFTNAELYGWMVSEMSTLHYQAFQLALDLARQAEACMNFELDEDGDSILGFGHWDSLRKGLLSGEKLTLDLRRLEAHYLAKNGRRHELVKHVSLARLDPAQLIALRATGACEFALPEVIFDLDHPGHYRRRIKSVAVTLPALAGPQTTIGCDLQIDGSWIRNDTTGVTPEGLTAQPAVHAIATSSGQNDSGLFHFDFRDERYLPFEGAGVVSHWKLTLPKPTIAQFDYRSISDVVLHIHYTSVSDGTQRIDVENALTSASFGRPEDRYDLLLSLRFDFADHWAAWTNANQGALDMSAPDRTLDLKAELFPYLAGLRRVGLHAVKLIGVPKAPNTAGAEHTLELDDLEPGPITLDADADAILSEIGSTLEDVYIVISYALT